MARTRQRRPHGTKGLVAAVTAVAPSAAAPPAHAAPEGRIAGAGVPGSAGGSPLVTPGEGPRAPSAAGQGIAEKYGSGISHMYGTALNGCAVRTGERQARRPEVADPSLGGNADLRRGAAVRASIASGVTYAVTAGNGGQPANLTSPTRVRQSLPVGVVERPGTRARFSGHGAALDLFAPGVAITSASFGSDIAKASLTGTSAVSAHVAGAAALHPAGHRRATAARAGAALLRRAVPGRGARAGSGSPNRLLPAGGP